MGQKYSHTLLLAEGNVPICMYTSEKLDLLWKNRTIQEGMVNLPVNTLDDLIRKESIEKFYIVEDTPVAR